MNWVLGARARLDLRLILSASGERFGTEVRERYRVLLQQAILDVADNPRRPGVAPLIGFDSRWIYHTRHARPRTHTRRIGRPRHVILFRFDDECVTIVRVLHEAMDLPRWQEDI